MLTNFRCKDCGKIDWRGIFRKLNPFYYRRVPVPAGESPLTFWARLMAKRAHCPAKPIDFGKQVLPDDVLIYNIPRPFDEYDNIDDDIHNVEGAFYYTARKLQEHVIDDIDDDLAG